MTAKSKSNWFDPNESFFDLTIVRLTFIGITLLTTLIAGAIIFHGDYTRCYSAVCFNEAVSIFKVPLGTLSTLIPIIAVFAANHRSEQTKHQLELSREQNNFSNYYTHLEEFEKYIENSKPRLLGEELQKGQARSLHRAIFPKAIEGEIGILDSLNEFVDEIYDTCIAVLEELKGLAGEDDNKETRLKIYSSCLVLTQLVDNIEMHFNLNLKGKDISSEIEDYYYKYFELDTSRMASVAPYLSDILSPIESFASFYFNVINFIPHITIPNKLNEFQKYTYNKNSRLYCSEAQPFNIKKT